MTDSRSRELAVHTALGASQFDVVRLILGQMMTGTCAGIAAGVAMSFVLVRSIAALLYGITPHDPLTFLVVPLILLGVAAAACVAPARRAATLDPLRTLRG